LIDKGNLLYDLQMCIEAIPYLDKARALDPNDKNALYNKEEALKNLGNYNKAMTYFDKALAIDPNYEAAIFNKGQSYPLWRLQTQSLH
jgi:tetratricopeptide (TPR) repeat protein